MRNSQWCINHDPDKAEVRRRRASKGGKRGGRGRPQAELYEVKGILRALVGDVLEGTTDRQDAAVVGQLLNTVIRAIGMEMRVREVDELAREVDELRALVEAGRSQGQRSYGA
jgi:hypothetical protein